MEQLKGTKRPVCLCIKPSTNKSPLRKCNYVVRFSTVRWTNNSVIKQLQYMNRRHKILIHVQVKCVQSSCVILRKKKLHFFKHVSRKSGYLKKICSFQVDYFLSVKSSRFLYFRCENVQLKSIYLSVLFSKQIQWKDQSHFLCSQSLSESFASQSFFPVFQHISEAPCCTWWHVPSFWCRSCIKHQPTAANTHKSS